MKYLKKENGFGMWIVMIVIGIIAVVGGSYLGYLNAKKTSPAVTRIQPSTTPIQESLNQATVEAPKIPGVKQEGNSGTKTQEQQQASSATIGTSPDSNKILEDGQTFAGKDIYIFVDDVTYNSLSQKINRLASDIESDLKSKVIVQHGAYSDPLEIRNILKQSYGRKALSGSVLIGAIPTFKRDDGYVYSDWFYSDLDDDCPIYPDGTFFSCNSLNSLSKRDVFTGRITPPVNAANGPALIEKYLDKDHNYRSGKISFPKKLLLYPSAIVNDMNDGKWFEKNDLAKNIALSIASQYRYVQNNVDVVADKDYPTSKNNYLNKLSQNRYEAALINIHGTPDGQFVSGRYGDSEIRADDIKKANPNILYVNLLSCSNGAFKSADYLAGWFLFSGDTLLVTALSQTAFVSGFLYDPPGAPTFFQPLTFLNSSLPLGQLFIHDSSLYVTQVFGDPTLRIQGNPLSPQLEISDSGLDFGTITSGPKTKTISIENVSDSVAKILTSPSWGLMVDGKITFDPSHAAKVAPGQNFIGFGIVGKNPYSIITIQPKQKTILSLQFSPAAYVSNDNIVSGKYSDIFSLLTSDPAKPFIDLTLGAQQE